MCQILVYLLLRLSRDQYLQACYNELADSSKLGLYKDYKMNYEYTMYLRCLNIRTFRHSMSEFRTSLQSLEIEFGKNSGCPRKERFCKLCVTGAKDEAHLSFFFFWYSF